MLSQAQADSTGSAMPESEKFDGPKPLDISKEQNRFAANLGFSLSNPGVGA